MVLEEGFFVFLEEEKMRKDPAGAAASGRSSVVLSIEEELGFKGNRGFRGECWSKYRVFETVGYVELVLFIKTENRIIMNQNDNANKTFLRKKIKQTMGVNSGTRYALHQK